MTPAPSAFPVNAGPIVGAGTRGDIITQSRSMPQVRSTMAGWMRPMIIAVTRQKIVDGENKAFESRVSGSGVIQPFSDEELKLLPEGDRSWKNSMLHATDSVLLETNDDIEIRGIKYKVMGRKDYTDYGYLRYRIIETYRPNSS